MAEGGAGQASELTALDQNMSAITAQIGGSNLQWFSNKLVEKAFTDQGTAQGIVTMSEPAANKVGRLMGHVYGAIKNASNKREKYNSLVDIFSHDAVYSDLAQKLNNSVLAEVSTAHTTDVEISTQSTQKNSDVPSDGMSKNRQIQSRVNDNIIPVPLCTVEYVKVMIKELKKKFRELKQNILSCIEGQQTPVADIRDVLTQLSPDDDDEYHKIFIKSNVRDIARAKSHSELFLIMNTHWNYLDPSLLHHLVDEMELDSVKPGMESYQADLLEFRKETPLNVFMQTQKRTRREIPPGFTTIVADFNWLETVMLENAEQFRQEYASHYSPYVFAMILIQVRPGSFIIAWLVPVAIVEKLKGNVPTKVLIKHRVQKLTVDGTCVYSDENVPVGENSNTSVSYASYFIYNEDDESSEEEVYEKEVIKTVTSSSGADSEATTSLPSTTSDIDDLPDVVKSKPSPSMVTVVSSSSQKPITPSYFRLESATSADSGFGSKASSTTSMNLLASTTQLKKYKTGSMRSSVEGSSQGYRMKAKHVTANHGNQLSVQCYEKKRAPFRIVRGSATSDGRFAYFTHHNSHSLYRYEYTSEEWEELPPCPYPDSALAIINEELTAIGGVKSDKLMTLRQGKWVKEYPPMLTEHYWPGVVTTPDGNYLIVIGGLAGGISVELLQLKTRKWYPATNMPKPLHTPSATILYGNQLNVFGWDTIAFSCSIQDLPSSNQPITSPLPLALSWTPLPQLPVTRSTVATLCGQLVIIGGLQRQSKVNSIYQLVDGQWMKIKSMTRERWRCLAVNQLPNKVMIVGGIGTEDSVEECIAFDV